jgi:hypothetical protein
MRHLLTLLLVLLVIAPFSAHALPLQITGGGAGG